MKTSIRPIRLLGLFKSIGFIGLTTVLLGGCAQVTNIGVKTPPIAKVGDGQLDLTLTTSNKQPMVQGTKLVISIYSNSSSSNATPIAGDIFILSQNDRQVRVSIPLDSRAVGQCKKKNQCSVDVIAYQAGKPAYRSSYKAGYQAKTNHISLKLDPAQAS